MSSEDDPLYIEDFAFLPQECTSYYTEFDHDKQTEWAEAQMEAGLAPDRFMRVWAHTHPGTSASPSTTDWETFQETHGHMPWGVMLIMGTSNEFVCVFRVKDDMFNIPVEVDEPEYPIEWDDELKNVRKKTYKKVTTGYGNNYVLGYDDYDNWEVVDDILIEDVYGWKRSNDPKWRDFSDAMKAICGNRINTANCKQWSPSKEELLQQGPCQTIIQMRKMYANVANNFQAGVFEDIVEKYFETMCGDERLLWTYRPEYGAYYEPFSFLYCLQTNEIDSESYSWYDESLWEYVYYDSERSQWYIRNQENWYDEMLSFFFSQHKTEMESAMTTCITAANQWPDEVGPEIDEFIKKQMDDFFDSLEEYTLCQQQHETNDTSDTPA